MECYSVQVWSRFVYLTEGCGRTQAKINDAIPHTEIDIGVWAQDMPTTYLYKE